MRVTCGGIHTSRDPVFDTALQQDLAIGDAVFVTPRVFQLFLAPLRLGSQVRLREGDFARGFSGLPLSLELYLCRIPRCTKSCMYFSSLLSDVAVDSRMETQFAGLPDVSGLLNDAIATLACDQHC